MYAVLFDIDGTLLQTGGAGQQAFQETFQEVFQLAELPDGIPFAGRSDRAIAGEIMQRSGIEPSVAHWQKFQDDYCQRIDRVLARSRGQVLPGVVALCDTLAGDEHVAVGLLTGNTAYGAKAKTTAYGLADRFAFGGYGDLRTDRDQIAEDAQQAAAAHVAQGSPAETLCGTMVIGDTPADVRCGRAIGAYVVAVATGRHSWETLEAAAPDLLLHDLTETDQLLAEVAAARQRCRLGQGSSQEML